MKRLQHPLSTVIVIILSLYIVSGTGCASSTSEQRAATSKYHSQLPGFSDPAQLDDGAALERSNTVNEKVIDSNSYEDTTLAASPTFVLANHYTVDFGLFDTLSAVEDFVREYDLDSNEAGIAEVQAGGTRGYLLAYGVYVSRDRALLAASRLAKQIKTSIVVRPLAEIAAMTLVDQ